MSPVSSSQRSIRFGDFNVDLHSGELRKHGIRVKLQVQPFQVLQVLLEHPGEVVTREELQKRIWPADTFVDFDQGLNNAVKRLREALGDDAEKPHFIETLSKRGYRFIGAVHNGATAATSKGATAALAKTSAPETRRKGFVWGLGLGVALLAALALVLALNTGGMRDRLFGKGVAPRIQSLAVLPLQNLSADPTQEYFSDGMTDALITDLAQIGGVKVISRTSSMQYKQTTKSLPEIARELNVDGIIEGTVQRSGDRVRITAQLIYGPSDKHLWANSYEQDMRDIFALERDVTEDIARQVQARLLPQDRIAATHPRPTNSKALDAYLQGNYHLQRYGRGAGVEEMKKASDMFQQAIDADPKFAPAYFGLANVHAALPQVSPEDSAIARKAEETGLALDPNSPQGQTIRADNKWRDLDWSGAEKEFRRALALNPNNAAAHDDFCETLGEMGRLDEALKECQLSQELDPNNDHMAGVLYRRGEYDHAIAILRMMIDRHPDDGALHYALFQCFEKNKTTRRLYQN